MKDVIKTISKNNKNLIESYKNDFGKVLDTQTDRDLFLSEAYIYLYIQINKTIIALDYRENEITTISNLLGDLLELKRIFFKVLNKKFYSNSWENIVELMQNYDDEYKYIYPSMFNEKHLDLVIQKLYKKNDLVANLAKPQKKHIGKIYFDVAVEFANGKIYDLIKDIPSEKKISEIIFVDHKFKPTSYRPFINNSLSHRPNNERQSIFKRKNAEIELNEVVKYCYSKKFIISPKFIEACKKHKINLEL